MNNVGDMITSPELMESGEITGRRTLLKSLVKAVWGIPAGIVGLLLGALMVYGKVKKPKESEGNNEEGNE